MTQEKAIQEAIEHRAKYFRDNLHKYEAQRLEECLRTIKELIPPDWYENNLSFSEKGDVLRFIDANIATLKEAGPLLNQGVVVLETVREELVKSTHQSSKQFSEADVLKAIGMAREEEYGGGVKYSDEEIIASLTPKEHSEGEIEARDLLDECRLQLEYLNDKFKETGTTNSVLAKVKAFLDQPPKK